MLDGVVSLRPGCAKQTPRVTNAAVRRVALDVLNAASEAQPTMSRVKRLLIPTDFSPTSDIAFNYALEMAAVSVHRSTC